VPRGSHVAALESSDDGVEHTRRDGYRERRYEHGARVSRSASSRLKGIRAVRPFWRSYRRPESIGVNVRRRSLHDRLADSGLKVYGPNWATAGEPTASRLPPVARPCLGLDLKKGCIRQDAML